MSQEQIDILSKLGLPALETLRDQYITRNDFQSAARVRSAINSMDFRQTEEASRSGQLSSRRNVDPDTGRVTHTFVGDPMAWMQHFMTGAQVCSFNKEICTGANSLEAKMRAARMCSVEVGPGERVIVVKE
jgi:hypothetical protein